MRTVDWGLIDYETACEQQLQTVEEVRQGADDVLLFCTHPPVVTLGRGTFEDDVTDWSGPVVETSRGGRATYHGPNQIVVYPILNLKKERTQFGPRDIHGYLRSLEQAIVAALHRFDIPQAEARTTKMQTAQGELSLTGVWVGEKKIASIGIAVRQWVTYHGLAINVEKDENAFRGIHPCGFQSDIMTSMEECLSHPVSRPDFQATLESTLINTLE